MRSKNHFVSQSYLKNWCDSENNIWCYRTLVPHDNVNVWKKVSPRAVAYHLHLYSQLKDQELDDEVEQWFDKEFESPAQSALNRVMKDSRLSSDDWIKLIRFVALHDVRTPARLQEHLERAQEWFPEILEKIQTELPKRLSERKQEDDHLIKHTDHIPLKISPIYEKDKKEVSIKIESYVGRSTWLFSLKHILNNSIAVLQTHKWTIIRPSEGMKWFTSDNPVIKLNFISQEKYDLRGGWGVKNGNIIFPLDPDHLLLTQIGCNPPIKGTQFNKEMTLFIRKIIAENSYRMIFSNKQDPDIERYAPRIVDYQRFKQEQEMWEKWHKENTRLEEQFAKKKLE